MLICLVGKERLPPIFLFTKFKNVKGREGETLLLYSKVHPNFEIGLFTLFKTRLRKRRYEK